MNRPSVSVGRLLFAVACVIAVWSELLCHHASSWSWPSIDNLAISEGAVRVLLVSDPQLQGVLHEPPGALGIVSRWDADNYLRRTYQLAYSYVQPDGVVFLGDLLDEGSIAAHHHYHQYHQRFKKIFDVPHKEVNIICIPGDNDIGGEGALDPKTSDKVWRFQSHFSSKPVTNLKFLSFMHFNMDYNEQYRGAKKKEIEEKGKLLDQNIRILLNHQPVLQRWDANFLQAFQTTKVQLSITGHDHTAKMISCHDCLTRDPSKPYEYDLRRDDLCGLDDWVHFDLDDKAVTELMIPTCSYRMGVPQMGYGVLIIESSGKVHFSVLWSSSRYRQLYVYVAFLCVAVVWSCARLRKARR